MGRSANKSCGSAKKGPASAGHTDARQHYGYRKVVQYIPFDTLDAVFDDDALLLSILSFLLHDGATSKRDCAVLAPLLSVSKDWKKAIRTIVNQMRYDHLNKVLSGFVREGAEEDEAQLLELFYLPPPAFRSLLPNRSLTNSSVLHRFLDKILGGVGYPDGVLFIKRTSTNAEMRDLLLSPTGFYCDPVFGIKNRYINDGGKWIALIPHFRFSETFHVINNFQSDSRSRVLYFGADSGELKEFIGDGEYIPLRRNLKREKTAMDPPPIQLFKEIDSKDRGYHRLVRFLHVKGDNCKEFIKQKILPAFQCRPTRNSSTLLLHPFGDSPSTSPIAMTFSDENGLLFTVEDLNLASEYLHELGGARPRSVRENEGGNKGYARFVFSPSAPVCNEYSILQRCRLFKKTRVFQRDIDLLTNEMGARDVNDNLVDFFMCWMTMRQYDDDDDIMFLPSNFFHALQMLGADQMSKYLKGNNIDVFKKRFVLLPYYQNQSGWFLCVIANPGSIMNEYATDEDQSDNQDMPTLLTCNVGNRRIAWSVENSIRELLNIEIRRLRPDGESSYSNGGPFHSCTFESFKTVRSKNLFCFQHPLGSGNWIDNDGGLFVCLSAYAFYLIKYTPLTYGAMGTRSPYFDGHFSSFSEFSFTSQCIERFGDEFFALLENLRDIQTSKIELHERLKKRSVDSWEEYC